MPKPKRKKVTPYRKSFLKAERIWKEIAFTRDGRFCQVLRYYDHAGLQHSQIYQVDHCFPRGDHNLFFHPKNGTVVCSTCNASKSWKTGAVEERIREIVRGREGGMEFGLMLEMHLSHQPNLNWKDPEWLEKKVIPELEAYLEDLKSGVEYSIAPETNHG